MQIKGKARKYCKAGRGAQYVFRSVENIGQEYGRVDGWQDERWDGGFEGSEGWAESTEWRTKVIIRRKRCRDSKIKEVIGRTE